MTNRVVKYLDATYPTLNSAVAASADADTISIEGTWAAADTTPVTWNKAVIVTADADSRQTGRPWRTGDTCYRHKVASGHAFTVTANVDITGINIQSDSSGVSDELFRAAGAYGCTLTNCQLGFTGNVDQQDVWYTENSSTRTLNFVQCFFYDVGRSIVDVVTGGQSGTLTVNFNSCASLNIGADGARFDGSWFGSSVTAGGDTFAVNAHNCLLNSADLYAFASESAATFNVSCTYSITNPDSFATGYDSLVTTGSVTAYVWTEAADPGVGDRVGMLDITAGDYDPTLTDHANNDAIAFHATLTGSGLTIPALDIKGQSRDTSTPLFDVGPHAITLAAGGTTHATTGVLTGAGVVVAGTASRTGIVIDVPIVMAQLSPPQGYRL